MSKIIFNKQICLANIYWLARQKNIKIGDLEKSAGVSTGYLSRLNKEDSTTNPSIECLTSIASDLNIPLDILISTEVKSLSATDAYILQFLRKLTDETNSDTLVWELETGDDYRNIQCDENVCMHPLFTNVFYGTPGTDEPTGYYPEYKSSLQERICAYELGNCYKVNLPNSVSFVYIIEVKSPTKGKYYDMHIIGYNQEQLLCSTTMENMIITAAINKLYSGIECSTKRLHINDNIKTAIDSYLNGTKDDGNIDF